MHVDTFTDRMNIVDHYLQDEHFDAALEFACQLRQELMDESSLELEQVCWPLYYELRALHALARWDDFIFMMHRYSSLLLGMGPMDHAYVHSLAMEAAAYTGHFDDFIHWARQSFESRIIDQDIEALQSALQTARALLEVSRRLDLFPTILDCLTGVAQDHQETELADLAHEWSSRSREHLQQQAQ